MAFVPTPHRSGRAVGAVQKDAEQGKNGEDSSLPGNRFLELKALRPAQRTHAIRNKLISDPENRTDLTGAITVVGTCFDMCPEFERHEREFQKDVDEWEKIPGTNPKRIDHARAVKKYRRSAAGNDDPLPSDLRPPHILKKTLDYLLEDLLPTHGLAATYGFIRDRTRAIRTDFVIQHVKGPSAIECFERIARFHILAVHAFCDGEGAAMEEKEDIRGFDYWLEVEQMMKTLQSLIQFYDDRLVTDPEPPNEAEFRAYYLLAHIRSNSILHRLHTLPSYIFLSPIMQSALEFRAYAQSLSVSTTSAQGGPSSASTHKSRAKSLAASPPLQNFFTRFFKRVEDPATSYLLACLLEYHFGGVRKGAIHALWRAYSTRHRGVPITDVGKMLGLSSSNELYTHEEDIKVEEVVMKFGIKVELDNEVGEKRVILNKLSTFDQGAQIVQRHSSNLVETKRGGLSDVELVNGNFEKARLTWISTLQVKPATPTTSFIAPLPSMFTSPTPTPHVSYSSFPTPPSTQRTLGNWLLHSPASATFFATGNNPSPFGGNMTSAFAFEKKVSVPVYVPPTLATPSPSVTHFIQPVDSPNRQVFSTELASLSNIQNEMEQQPQRQQRRPVFQEENLRENLELRAQIKEKRLLSLEKEKRVLEEEVRQKEQKEQQRLEEEREKEKRKEEQRKQKEKEEEERKLIEREYWEQLKRRRRERRRIADLFFIGHIFDKWKRVVIRRGEVRRAFKRSILEMGAATGSSDDCTLIKNPTLEDVISWEDLSEFSVPEPCFSGVKRRRRSKSKKRMDDEMTLTAVRDAEKSRLKLWERGTFLRFVKGSRCRGDVWLSVSPQSKSTGEWLRVKFDVQTTFEEDLICVPHGNNHGPGLIIIDLTPSNNESVVQQDISRLRQVLSRLPSGGHHIPSVLILQWTGCESLPTSISVEVNSYLEQKIVVDVRLLAFMNDDLNDQFLHALNEIQFDTRDKLVRKASMEDIFANFMKIWDDAFTEAVGTCEVENSVDPSFNWSLYGQLIEAFINLLQRLAEGVAKTCQIDMFSQTWPSFDGSIIVDDRSAFQAITNYIESSWLAFEEPAIFLKTELVAEMVRNKKFDVYHVPSRVAHLVLSKFQTSTYPQSYFYVQSLESLPCILDFSKSLPCIPDIIDENMASKKNIRKRVASDDRHPNGGLSKKRYKQDVTAARVNVNGYNHAEHLTEVTGKEELPVKKVDALRRLRTSILKAKQSVEDFRAARANDTETEDMELKRSILVSDDSSIRTMFKSPSLKGKQARDDLSLVAFYSGKHTPTFLRASLPNSFVPQPDVCTSPASTPKPGPVVRHNAMDAKDNLTITIERARKRIQEAQKSRQNGVREK